MVSGLVTSPCDQLRIFSGDARLMRIASKSATGLAMSKGLERNKVFLRFLLSKTVASGQQPRSVPAESESLNWRDVFLNLLPSLPAVILPVASTGNQPLTTGN